MPFDQNITISGTRIRRLEDDADHAVFNDGLLLQVPHLPWSGHTPTNGWYSDDYLDDNDNVHKDGTGAASDGEPFPSFQFTVYDPNFQTPAWLQNANVYHILPDRFRNGDQTNDYCRTGSTTGCPTFYGTDPSTVIHYDTWNTQMCDPRNSSSSCFNNFTQFYNGDLAGVQSKLDYIQSLGFDTIYMNPIFAARSYHRYDTDNYLHIDPALGGDAAYASLQTRDEQARNAGDSGRRVQSRLLRRPLLRSLSPLPNGWSLRIARFRVAKLVPLQRQQCALQFVRLQRLVWIRQPAYLRPH